MDSLKFQLELIDKLTGPAQRETKAISQLEKNLLSARAALKSFEAQQAAAAKKAAVARGPEAVGKLELAQKKAIASEQVKIAKRAQAEQAKAERAQLKAAQQAEKAAARASIKEQAAQAKAEKAQLKEAEKARKLSAKAFEKEQAKAVAAQEEAMAGAAEQLGVLAGVYATAGAAALAFAAAVGAAIYSGAKLSIEAAEAKNDTLDVLDAFQGSAEAAERTYAAIEDITRDLAISQERASGLARELASAGVTNADALTDAIKSIASVESVLGAQAGGKIQSVIEKAAQSGKFDVKAKQLVGTGIQIQKLYEELSKRTGVGVKQVEAQLKAGKIKAEVGIAALTKVVDDKFGELGRKQSLDFGSQIQRLHDNISKLFEDVDTGPFLEALDKIVRLFDTATPAGKALHDVLTQAFGAIFKAVSAVGPYVGTFFKGLIIIALRLAIAFKPVLKQLGLIGGQKGSTDGLAESMSRFAFQVQKITEIFLKLQGLTVVWAVIKSAVYAAAQPFLLVYNVALSVYGAMSTTVDAIGWVIDGLSNLGSAALQAGSDLVAGLVDGVTNLGGEFVESVRNLAQQGIDVFKSVFKISSPSKVMDGMGQNLVLGIVRGIDTQTPAANDALAASVSPSVVTNNQSSTVKSGGIQVTIQAGAIQIVMPAGSDVGAVEDMLTNQMANIFENAAAQAGANPAANTSEAA